MAWEAQLSDRVVSIYCQFDVFPLFPRTPQASKPAPRCKRTTPKFKVNFLEYKTSISKMVFFLLDLFLLIDTRTQAVPPERKHPVYAK